MDNLANSQSHFDLKTLLDTTRLLVESHDPDFVMNNLLLISMGKVMASRAMVLLLDADHQNYLVAKTKGKLEYAEGQKIALSSLFYGSDGVQTTSVISGQNVPDILGDQGIATMFNIRTSDRHLGFLCLGKKLTGNFSKTAETGFLESLVFMSAVAIGNSQLMKELKETNRKLDMKVQEMHTLFDLSKEFNATIERNQIIRIFKFALLGQMLVRSFFLVIKKEQTIEIVAQGGMKSIPAEDELDKLFAYDADIIKVNEPAQVKYPFLAENQIEVLLRLNSQEDQPAFLGLGKRSGGQSYKKEDFNFLISLGNLVLLSLLKTYLLEEQIEKKRIDEELNLARVIQKKLLPDEIPYIKGIDLAAFNLPSRQVGGDYYDVIPFENNLFLAIADVTGKGVPASLLMANLQAMLQVMVPLNIDLAEATGKINTIIYKNTESDKFISFFWGKLDITNHVFTYVNAGHNPPYLFRAGTRDYEELSTGGILLGAMPTLGPYSEGSVKLGRDDMIVFFTDGVTEAMNSLEEEYAEKRLIKCIHKNKHRESGEVLNCIIDDVNAFRGNQLGDDLTLMVIKGT
ncbi:MAG: PP2C family protein-serine/threonine phosphatase [Balneolales bacterium]